MLAHDHDHASVFWIVHVQAVVLLIVLPRQLRVVGIICVGGTYTCWCVEVICEPQGTQQSMTSVPELVKLLGWKGGVFRLQHPKLHMVANLRRTCIEGGLY